MISKTPQPRTRSAPVPAEMRALVLDGTGFDHLSVRRVPTPRPGPSQVLARVDAAGICTSLIKLVEQGPDHKFVYGWDIARFPLILGDEGCVTLVEVGEALLDRYRPGQRYVVQPAVDHAPINHLERYRNKGQGIGKVAVGYTLPGHLAEYILVGEEVLAGGCLLPLPDSTIPYAHAALSEPFSCAVSAQEHHTHLLQMDPMAPRVAVKGLRQDGVTVVVGAGAMGRMHVDLALSAGPRAIVVADMIEGRLEQVRALFSARADASGIDLHTVNPASTDLSAAVDNLTDGTGADDVIVAAGSRGAIETAQGLVARGGVLNLFGGLKKGEEVVGFDTGIVHYMEINITGSSGGSPWDVARTLELMACRAVDAGVHIACIGDLEHTVEFLRMIKAQAINGKAVVYPHRRTPSVLDVKSWSAQDESSYLDGPDSAAEGR
jgi:threonine dehydrogenase-like Zn-dependent dehydrogenase